MLDMTRWCMAHRRTVVIAWIVIAIAVNVFASAVGRNYATNYTLPGTQSQRVVDLLDSHFASQSGDIDTIVFHNAHGSYNAPAVRAVIEPLLSKVAKQPHVVSVRSPYSAAGALQVSKDGHTAFAVVNFTKRANLLPSDTGMPILTAIDRIKVPGLAIAAGGQVIEQAEGFNIGPATSVGVIAALVILLLTFGSLLAAGLPLVTAGIGLVTGLALVGLSTRVFSVSNVAPDLALMIGLGVGVDYALFIVTRFRESYRRFADTDRAVLEAMDTSGRAVVLAGVTVIIALLGMFATGVNFMYGLSIASVLAVLMVMLASLTLLPALLSKAGARVIKLRGVPQSAATHGGSPAPAATVGAPSRSAWRRWSLTVQARPRILLLSSLAVMVICLVPFFSMRMQSSDAGNDPPATSTHRAYHMLARGFGPGFNGPLLVAVEMKPGSAPRVLSSVRSTLAGTAGVIAVTPPTVSPSGTVAVMQAYPRTDPQSVGTTQLVHSLRGSTLPALQHRYGVRLSIGGFTAASIDFSHVLSQKLPLFIAIVVVLSALLLLVIFRSILIPLQAAAMNLLSIGGALGATVAVFQWGWLSSLFGISPAPIEPWVPVLMFAVVFGLSMDYEVFLISRVREEWVHRGDASQAVADGIAFTGRVITAAAAIMVCVFLSFVLGSERTLKEFGFGLAAAVFLDAFVIRCVMLPALLELLGKATWRLPPWLDRTLPDIKIEGSSPAFHPLPEQPAEGAFVNPV